MTRAIDPIQLLTRHAERFQQQHVLVIDPPDVGAIDQLRGWSAKSISTLNRDHRMHLLIASRFGQIIPSEFGLLSEAIPGDLACCLVFLPKGKRLLELTAHWLRSVLPAGCRLYLVGTKKKGIAGGKTTLGSVFGSVTKIDSARHCTLYGVVQPSSPGPGQVLRDWATEFAVKFHNRTTRVMSLPGVFSDGKLDAGTALLLTKMDVPQAGRVLDLGCGSGVVGAHVASIRPEIQVDLVDIGAASLLSSELTIAANGLTNTKVWVSDLFDDVPNHYDMILSNPPFHTGHETDYHTPEHLIVQASRHLVPDGSLLLVANRFLPYQTWMEKQFTSVSLLYEDRRYRVWRAAGPRK